MLFGYRLDMSDSRCRLLSQYAASPNDVLLFDLQRNERGALVMALLENAYSRQLDDELLVYLRQLHSIPAFLAQHSLELFNSQTFVGGSSNE